jgi:eukaryotic-like serine/threonine-protein kinase
MELLEHTDAPIGRTDITVQLRATPFPGGRSATEPAAIPHVLGRYRVIGEVARGGMGVILRAYDPNLDREVAVKLLSDDHAPDSEAGQRLAEEARILSRLHHPGVMPVYEAGTLADGRAFFAMPFVEGQTLAAKLAARSNPKHDLPSCLHVFERVCLAVAYAHSHDVVHRDLKPANVMLGRFGEVLVMDWGVAGIAGRLDGSWVFGTPAYMPLEQARGHSAADPQSDMFGLGAVLCEVISGEPPYVGLDLETVTQLAADGDQTETRRRLNCCGADSRLIELTLRCLAPDRMDRPASAHVVARAVRDFLGRGQSRRAEILTAALALGMAAAVGAAAGEYQASAKHGSPSVASPLTSTQSLPHDPQPAVQP